MKIRLCEGLLYVTATIEYHGKQLQLRKVLLDTGSVGTLFAIDRLLMLGLEYEPDDRVHRIRGVGGVEFVFTKRLDRLSLDELAVSNFEIEVGAMDYGFEIDGIIGIDFLLEVGAMINLATLELKSASP